MDRGFELWPGTICQFKDTSKDNSHSKYQYNQNGLIGFRNRKLPVVRREDDEGVVQDVGLLQGGDDAPDGVVHLGEGVSEAAAVSGVTEQSSCGHS